MGGGSSDSTAAFWTSSTTNTSQTTGGSGQDSPTVNAGGNVTIENAGGRVSLAALAGMGQVVKDALTQQSGTTTQALQELADFNASQAAAQVDSAKSTTDLLASVLANNQSLAQNVQSGGATTGMDLTTKVVIGALALMGLLVLSLLFKK
jgi:hypothetical protein